MPLFDKCKFSLCVISSFIKDKFIDIYNVSRNLEMSQREKAYPQHDSNSLEGLKG